MLVTWKNRYMYNATEFETHYRSLSDDEIEDLAQTRAGGLRPEALQALRAEIARRGLADGLERAISAQTRAWTQAELLTLVSRYRAQPCPLCGQARAPLNAVRTAVAGNAIVYSWRKHEFLIGCPECLRKRLNNLSAKSLVFGWWGLPLGPVLTVMTLWRNEASQLALRSPDSTPELLAYVAANIGEISAKLLA